MGIDWNKLRPWNGSQAAAFEELCCQLAAGESLPSGSRFFRKGTPDAGIECFWRLPDGEEWGWQAKYFRSAPNSTQWKQIDKSVNNALSKHARLAKYTVCLPADLPDARLRGRKSSLQKWEDHVSKWRRLAAGRGRTVSFEYWGQTDIGKRLSEERNRGRLWFWFDTQALTDCWFQERLKEALANAGPHRYSPELNVDLPIASNFESLGRTPAFFQRIERLYSAARVAFEDLRPLREPDSLRQKYDHISATSQELFTKLEPWVERNKTHIEWSVTLPIPWDDIRSLATRLSDELQESINEVRQLREEREKTKQAEARASSDDLGSYLHSLWQFDEHASRIAHYSGTNECRLSNLPALLVVGEAGQGKTHLLCRLAERDTQGAVPRLLLFGEQFQDGEPWSQIIRLLGLDCSRDEFLGALEAAAQANKCRALIFIDALNEGPGNRLWSKFLPGMLTALADRPWLGICVTVRSAYENLVLPEALRGERIVRIEHPGFADLGYEAAASFFGHFKIEPSTPLLLPEFENPLFLKLFCQSLNNEGLTRVPPGLHGITKVFRFFIDSVDKKLARPEWLDYDPRSAVVRQAVERLADEMATRETDRLPLDEASTLVNTLLPREGHERSLFRHLESEGVLMVVPNYGQGGKGQWSESVRFVYQRFSDHLIAKRLLDRHLDAKKPEASFSSRCTLGRLLRDERACWRNSGLLHALAIQVPERTKRELPDLVPHVATSDPMLKAFVESLVWRDPGSFSKATDRYVNQYVVADPEMHAEFLKALIALATTPRHPLNGDRLHAILSRYEMAARDAWWSIFLHHQWREQGPVDRLVRWAWDETEKTTFEDEVIRLAGITLGWFFTTANRFLRDRATKAMVRLCENRIPVLRQVMAKFVDVNDPYVSERLYAVAYGCAMRTDDHAGLALLAQDVYRWVFESGQPPPHVLLRDYARGVIETALHRGASLDIDVAKIRPPYRSDWPSIDVPALDDLKAWGEWKEGMRDEEWARVHVYSSVMQNEDFSRYVIGDLHQWSSEGLRDPHRATHRELHDDFVQSLTERQWDAWNRYLEARRLLVYRWLALEGQDGHLGPDLSEEELAGAIDAAEQQLVRSLRKGSSKHRLFCGPVLAYLSGRHHDYAENGFDGELARRWMIKRIIDMGWTMERFGEFDRYVARSDHGRDAHKPERIGKKYQWLAFHELLARLSDNFKMRESSWGDAIAQYRGSWSLSHGRDLDPSNLLTSIPQESWGPHTNTWWFPVAFDRWDDPADEVEWLKHGGNLPCAAKMIEVTATEDRSGWLTLHGFYSWEQPTPPGEERYRVKRRAVQYWINGYLVRKADCTRLLKWAKTQSWMGRWMPKSHARYRRFLGEFFWSPAFKDDPYCDEGAEGWTRGQDDRVPAEILVADDEYVEEARGFDCSIDETISTSLPCRFLVEGMNLDWRGREGEWYDRTGGLVAFDPSVRSQGPGVLLFGREPLLRFLEGEGLTVFWTVLGEKQSLGGWLDGAEHRGYLEINGAYLLRNGNVLGASCATFVPPPR